MVKQRDLIGRIARMAKTADVVWVLHSQGGRHEVWLLNGRKIEIPRHREINELTAKGIIRTAQNVIDGKDTGR